MPDTLTVRIGISSARELELQVDDPKVVSDEYAKAIEDGDAVLWITDSRGHEFGVSVSSIAFIEFERPQERGVGFRSG
jgi:hypothetical protein